MKKVPIEEIREKATKPPFRVKRNADIYGERGYFIGSVESNSGEVKPQDTANAQLIAHCLNTHQMLLDALKLSMAGLELMYQHVRDKHDKEGLRLFESLRSPKTGKEAIEVASFVEVEECSEAQLDK